MKESLQKNEHNQRIQEHLQEVHKAGKRKVLDMTITRSIENTNMAD